MIAALLPVLMANAIGARRESEPYLDCLTRQIAARS